MKYELRHQDDPRGGKDDLVRKIRRSKSIAERTTRSPAEERGRERIRRQAEGRKEAARGTPSAARPRNSGVRCAPASSAPAARSRVRDHRDIVPPCDLRPARATARRWVHARTTLGRRAATTFGKLPRASAGGSTRAGERRSAFTYRRHGRRSLALEELWGIRLRVDGGLPGIPTGTVVIVSN